MTFISIEGPEGVGKSTQIQLLRELLPKLFPDRQFLFTREPGGTPRAELIRQLILSEDMKDANGATMFGLFSAARHDHVDTLIRPAIDAGKVVITDRFFGSSYAYQMHAQDDLIPKALFGAHLHALGLFPTLTLVFDMDEEASQRRVRERTGDAENHFDSRGIEFHRKLRDGFRAFVSEYSGYNVQLINAAGSVGAVNAAVMALIEPLLE